MRAAFGIANVGERVVGSELEFIDEIDEEERDRFRELPAVRAVLDAVPDPLSGLLVFIRLS